MDVTPFFYAPQTPADRRACCTGKAPRHVRLKAQQILPSKETLIHSGFLRHRDVPPHVHFLAMAGKPLKMKNKVKSPMPLIWVLFVL